MASQAETSNHFGIENIPFGIASRSPGSNPECVSRFENNVIFLTSLSEYFIDLPLTAGVFNKPTLNEFAALGRDVHRQVRQVIQRLIQSISLLPSNSIADIKTVQMNLPVSIGDFTDFSCSPHHNRRAGAALMAAPERLPPGYPYQPLGYAGRCSSIFVSGTPVKRPRGQRFTHGLKGLAGQQAGASYGPSQWMDYEMEMGVIVGKPVSYGEAVSAKSARNNVFGFVLVNDWSARDIQQLEMIPVGPLNSKNAGTTISPWVITPDALEPFTVSTRPKENQLAPHLEDPDGRLLSVGMEVSVGEREEPHKLLGKANVDVMDWTFEQLIAHQSSAGYGLRTGDLLAIGTVSGPGREEHGCLMEQFAPGQGVRREYLKDGSDVLITGFCGDGVGFGECRAALLPSAGQSTWP